MNTRIAAIGLIILAIVVGVFTYNIINGKRDSGRILTTKPPINTAPNTTQPPATSQDKPVAKIFVVSPDNGGDENNLIEKTVPITDAGSPARSAIIALLSAPGNPFPQGTSLLHIRIENKIAYVDFSKEFKQFHGSSSQGAQVLNAILKTLGQFHTIDKVQILVDGAPVEDFGGDYDIKSPIDVVR